jgi:hypothetical protein
MKKGQLVTYEPMLFPGRKIQAIVRQAHRDNTVTIESRFELDANGKHRGGYLGYKFRVPAKLLSAQP